MTDTPALREETTPAESFQASSVLRRLFGLMYDLFIMMAIIMVVGMICEGATAGRLDHMGANGGFPWWYQVLQYLVLVAYFMVSWLRGGQTLGMRPWQMHLRLVDGRRVHLTVAIVRAVVVSLPILLLSLVEVVPMRTAIALMLAAWAVFYGVALFHPRRCALHDILADTEIVHTAAPRQKRRRKQTQPDANRNA